MIELYSGTPGSGKSLHLSVMMIWALRMKKPIIANYPINFNAKKATHTELFTYKDNSEITPKYLVEYSKKRKAELGVNHLKEDSILLIIDECQIMFNSRDSIIKSADGEVPRKDWVKFFTQHRKFGFHILLVAQFDRMIDRQIRSLIEYEHIHRKLSNYGWRGWLLSFFMLTPANMIFVDVKVWYPLKEKVGSEFFKYRRYLGEMYDSYADFEEASASIRALPPQGKGDKGAPPPDVGQRTELTDCSFKYSDKLYIAYLLTRKNIKFGSPDFKKYSFKFVKNH